MRPVIRLILGLLALALILVGIAFALPSKSPWLGRLLSMRRRARCFLSDQSAQCRIGRHGRRATRNSESPMPDLNQARARIPSGRARRNRSNWVDGNHRGWIRTVTPNWW
jgi:hypothetical protein